MAQEMKTVLFRNFSDQVFSSVEPHEVDVRGVKMQLVDENCRWNGENYTFKPGEPRYMLEFMAQHFAKHLVNRELVRMGLDNDTSPKRPKDNPRFMALWNKAYIEDPASLAMSADKAVVDVLEKNKDLEIARLKAELELVKKGEKNPPVAPVIGANETAPAPVAQTVSAPEAPQAPVEDGEDGFDDLPEDEETEVSGPADQGDEASQGDSEAAKTE